MDYKKILEEYDFIEDKEIFLQKLILPKPTFFRINTLKAKPDKIIKALKNYDDLVFEDVEVLPNFFVVKQGNITKKPEHLFGYLYVQDLSSALVTNYFNNDPKLIVDFCASPGGKTTLLSTLFPKSLIIANDIGNDRIRALVHNIQRMGALNVIVTQTNSKFFPYLDSNIDIILLDVPCSSESNLDNYENYNINKHHNFVDYVTKLQRDILSRALQIASENTQIIYSTCTFNPLENEAILDHYLKQNKIKLDQIEITSNEYLTISKGLTKYKDQQFSKELEKAIRIYPGKTRGMFFSKLSISEFNHTQLNQKEQSICKIINIDEEPIFQGYRIKKIKSNLIYELLSLFDIPQNIVDNFYWFYKEKDNSKIEDIYVSTTDKFILREKGPLRVEHFGIKAFRYFKPLKTYKPTSSLLTILNNYILKNYVELKLDIKLLRKFLAREEIDSNEFKEINVDNQSKFVAVKFNGLVIGCASIKNNKIISEIPISKANFVINLL